MHCAHASPQTQVRSVENIRPGIDYTAILRHNGLIEVESIEVEGHGRDTECCEPDTHDRPNRKEEVKAAGIVERGVLEYQPAKVTVAATML